MKIEKGKCYKCIKTFVMNSGKVAFIKGSVYKSNKDNELVSLVSKFHGLNNSIISNKYFIEHNTTATIEEKEVVNKYSVKCKSIEIDVYDVLKAFNVTNPAIQHAIKKLLKGGDRGYKNTIQDFKEAVESINRGIELEN